MTTQTADQPETLVVMVRPAGNATRARALRHVGEKDLDRVWAGVVADAVRTAAAWSARAGSAPRNVALYAAEGSDDAWVGELAAGAGARVVVPSGASLAEQLKLAVTDEMDRGAAAIFVLVPGTPTLGPHVIEEGLRAAMFHDVVLGPTFSGHVYGVALRRLGDDARETLRTTTLFQDAAWNEPHPVHVLTERACAAHLSTHWLGSLPSMLDGEHLSLLRPHLRYQELRGRADGAATLAAIHHKEAPAPPALPARALRGG